MFFQHHFNEQYGLWNRLEINGDVLSIDMTFNHQLWFAACASLIDSPRKKEIQGRVVRFLDCLTENLTILNNGLIYHPITRKIKDKYSTLSLKVIVKKSIFKIRHILYGV